MDPVTVVSVIAGVVVLLAVVRRAVRARGQADERARRAASEALTGKDRVQTLPCYRPRGRA